MALASDNDHQKVLAFSNNEHANQLKNLAEAYAYDEQQLIVPIGRAGLIRVPPNEAMYDKWHLPAAMEAAAFGNELGSGWKDLWSKLKNFQAPMTFRGTAAAAIKVVKDGAWPTEAEAAEAAVDLGERRRAGAHKRVSVGEVEQEPVFLKNQPSALSPILHALTSVELGQGLPVKIYVQQENARSKRDFLYIQSTVAMLGINFKTGIHPDLILDDEAELYAAVVAAAKKPKGKRLSKTIGSMIGTISVLAEEHDQVYQLDTDLGTLSLSKLNKSVLDRIDVAIKSVEVIIRREQEAGRRGDWYAVKTEQGWTLRKGTATSLSEYSRKIKVEDEPE